MPNADILTNFTTAFYSKFTALIATVHNDFYLAVGGRLYDDEAPEGAVMPFAVYSIVSAPKEKTFSEEYTNFLIQLSIFSSAPSSSEIKLAYHYAHTLFDEQPLTITGSTLVWMRETNLATMKIDYTTLAGTTKVRHYAIDLEIMTSLD